jgi:hypothetical protein
MAGFIDLKRIIRMANEYYGERSSVGRAPDCDSGGRGFKPHRSPHIYVFQEDHISAIRVIGVAS